MPSHNQELIAWKEKGKKAVGYFCQSFPKEIIYAGGVLPLRILGDAKPIEEAGEFWTRYACCLSRSAVDLALRGEYDLLDGFVMSYSCDVASYLAARWQQLPLQKGRFFYYLTRPPMSSPGAHELFVRELFEFRKAFEKHFNVWVSDANLRQSIAIYNENRSLLQEVDSLKKRGLISSVEAAEAAFSSMLQPPESNNAFLKSLISEAKQTRNAGQDARVKLFLSGATLPNTELFELIEEEGGIIIADDTCVGSRYSRGVIPTDEEPLNALATHYLAEKEVHWQCPSMVTEDRLEGRLRYIEESVAAHGIKGVIFAIPLYCDMHGWDRVSIQSKLKEKGIPTLAIDQEGSMKSESIRTRVAAFLEMID
jgi:benzoyl-CoA reductase subunit C